MKLTQPIVQKTFLVVFVLSLIVLLPGAAYSQTPAPIVFDHVGVGERRDAVGAHQAIGELAPSGHRRGQWRCSARTP